MNNIDEIIYNNYKAQFKEVSLKTTKPKIVDGERKPVYRTIEGYLECSGCPYTEEYEERWIPPSQELEGYQVARISNWDILTPEGKEKGKKLLKEVLEGLYPNTKKDLYIKGSILVESLKFKKDKLDFGKPYVGNPNTDGVKILLCLIAMLLLLGTVIYK